MHEFASGSRLRLTCPAKVNLALSAGPPRDDGMHPIASWMVALDFADTLTLDRLEPGELVAVRRGVRRFRAVGEGDRLAAGEGPGVAGVRGGL